MTRHCYYCGAIREGTTGDPPMCPDCAKANPERDLPPAGGPTVGASIRGGPAGNSIAANPCSCGIVHTCRTTKSWVASWEGSFTSPPTITGTAGLIVGEDSADGRTTRAEFQVNGDGTFTLLKIESVGTDAPGTMKAQAAGLDDVWRPVIVHSQPEAKPPDRGLYWYHRYPAACGDEWPLANAKPGDVYLHKPGSGGNYVTDWPRRTIAEYSRVCLTCFPGWTAPEAKGGQARDAEFAALAYRPCHCGCGGLYPDACCWGVHDCPIVAGTGTDYIDPV